MHLVGYLPHYPQAVAGHVGKRVHRHPADGTRGTTGSVSRKAGTGPGVIFTGGRISVVNLAVQGSSHAPNLQPPQPGTMPDGIGGQFMNDQDDVRGPGPRHPGLNGESPNSRSEHVQRA